MNNNYGSLEDLILLSKIPMGRRNNFFEIYRQFGASVLKKFHQPCLHHYLSSAFSFL